MSGMSEPVSRPILFSAPMPFYTAEPTEGRQKFIDYYENQITDELEDGDFDQVVADLYDNEITPILAALKAFLASRDEETGTIDVSPNPCNACTGGCTPATHDKGQCLYHRLLAFTTP
jgi:hypothetical protein